MIRKDLFDTMNNAGIVNTAFAESDNCFAFLNIDVLNGCIHSCAGCFVNKGINSEDLESDLDTVAKVAREIEVSGVHLEEVVVGPTDFFSAKNTEELLTNPKFIGLFTNPKTVLSFISTLSATHEKIEQYVKILEQSLPNLDIDLIIAIDADEVYNNEEKIQDLKSKLEIFNRSSMKFEPAFQINIHPANIIKEDRMKLSSLSKLVKDEFNTILEFNPSLLRAKHRKQYENLEYWAGLMQENASKQDDMIYTMKNNNHRGVTNLVFNFRKGVFYLCPFIYENVFIYQPEYAIPKSGNQYSFEDLHLNFQAAIERQFEYAEKKADKCSGCSRLVSCSYKNVLTFMENNQITGCFLNMYTEEQDGR